MVTRCAEANKPCGSFVVSWVQGTVCVTFASTVEQQARPNASFLSSQCRTACFFWVGTTHAQEAWLEWDLQTDVRLELSSVANADDEEKDIWPADLNQDGWTDVIVVRKEPFSAATEPPKADLLLMNVEGVLVDMTATLAPEFISNPSFARDIYVVDVDGDSWEDVVIVNTFNQQPMLYMNKGEDAEGNWLGLEDDSQSRCLNWSVTSR